MTVTVNMAAAMRLENPCRLSNFGGSGLDKKNKWLSNEHMDNDRCSKEYNKHSCYRAGGSVIQHERGGRPIEENGNRH